MRRRLVLFLLVVVLAAVPLLVAARSPRAAVSPAPSRPRLVVVLVVDQMRADYVDKYRAQWKGGLARLVNEGAWFREAAYPYLNTFTCVGHATISTGTFPATHGLVGNVWFDRREGKSVACTEDVSMPLIGYQRATAGGNSPARLAVPTFSDELRVQTSPPPRVVTFSMKDRTAITLAGHRADAVTWLSASDRTWVTSSFYTKAPVPFVQRFTDRQPVDAELGKVWERSLEAGAYAYPDEASGERAPAGGTTVFPHRLAPSNGGAPASGYAAWQESPFSDAYLERLAEAAIDDLDLGRRVSTDFLAISFSALDFVGHDFGPRSQEVQDLLAQLDRTLGRLLAHLDQRVGRVNYVVARTADHGVSPIPEQMAQEGLNAGRASATNLVRAVNAALDEVPGAGEHDTCIVGNDIYFGQADREKLAENRAAVERLVAKVQAEAGIARAVWAEDLRDRRSADDPLARAAALGYFPGRSGDLIVITKPYWFLVNDDPAAMAAVLSTTHGSPYDYDQRVPVLLMGDSIRPGQYLEAASPADIAPTLALLCGITLPHPDGRPLIQAIRTAIGAR